MTILSRLTQIWSITQNLNQWESVRFSENSLNFSKLSIIDFFLSNIDWSEFALNFSQTLAVSIRFSFRTKLWLTRFIFPIKNVYRAILKVLLYWQTDYDSLKAASRKLWPSRIVSHVTRKLTKLRPTLIVTAFPKQVEDDPKQVFLIVAPAPRCKCQGLSPGGNETPWRGAGPAEAQADGVRCFAASVDKSRRLGSY